MLHISFPFLAASLIWGSVGAGFMIYGKRQTSLVALAGGLVLIGISYFASSALQMNLLALIALAAMYIFRRAD